MSLNVSPFVARTYGRKRSATLDRLQAQDMENGALRAVQTHFVQINCNSLQQNRSLSEKVSDVYVRVEPMIRSQPEGATLSYGSTSWALSFL